MSGSAPWSYEILREATRGQALPAVLVDVERLDANVRRIAEAVRPTGKTVRLATKSVRVPALIRRILDVGGPVFRGLMCYSAREALFLAGEGHDDFLVAYPVARAEEQAALGSLVKAGKRVQVVVDSRAHVDLLEAAMAGAGRPLGLCLERDVSFRPFGGLLHLGVQRSPVRSDTDLAALVEHIRGRSHVELRGVMGYEAQIAGVPDRNPFRRLLNPAIRVMKRFSTADVRRKRERIARWLQARGIVLSCFNGGGTGSLASALAEPWLTEVTVGSGFLQSHLFDYYGGCVTETAFCFAIAVTRVPQPGLVTGQGGGFIASGAPGRDRAPLPFLPPGLTLLPDEGCGEVQTPLRVPRGVTLVPGDPVFFRPAKAGEIAERFNEYLLLEKGRLVGGVPTYRGRGHCFH